LGFFATRIIRPQAPGSALLQLTGQQAGHAGTAMMTPSFHHPAT
jgi:hypothetical protein